MCARDLALLAQPPFCCFSHRCSFHFLSWQFSLRVEARVVPCTQGFPSCKSYVGGQVLSRLGVPNGACPTGGSSYTRADALCWLRASCLFWSEEAYFSPRSSTHTIQRCLDKRVCPSRHPLSLAWDMALPSSPSPPLPVKHLFKGTHTHRHMRAHTCSHMITHIYM